MEKSRVRCSSQWASRKLCLRRGNTWVKSTKSELGQRSFLRTIEEEFLKLRQTEPQEEHGISINGGDNGSGAERSSYNPEVDVPLGKTLNPKCLLVCTNNVKGGARVYSSIRKDCWGGIRWLDETMYC